MSVARGARTKLPASPRALRHCLRASLKQSANSLLIPEGRTPSPATRPFTAASESTGRPAPKSAAAIGAVKQAPRLEARPSDSLHRPPGQARFGCVNSKAQKSNFPSTYRPGPGPRPSSSAIATEPGPCRSSHTLGKAKRSKVFIQ